MPPFARRAVILIPALIVLAAVGVWAYRALGPKPVESGPAAPELATHTAGGVRFEVEHRPGEYVARSADDSLVITRGGDVLDFQPDYVRVNNTEFPDLKPGDVVRWNLDGPLLVNGRPQAPHPIQPRELDAAATPLHWSPLPSQYPRDTPSVGWVGNGRQLVAAHGDGAVRVWDADKGAVVKTFTPDLPKGGDHGAGGLRAAVSPDGKTVAVCNINGEEVTLWDVATGNKTATFFELKRKVTTVRYAQDDLLFEARGGILEARDLSRDPRAVDAVEVVGKVHTQLVPPFAVSGDGWTIAWNDGAKVTIGHSIWVLPGATIKNVSSSGCLALSPDGKLLAVFDGTDRLAIYETKTGKPKHRLRWRNPSGGATQVTAMAFSPDGETLAVGDAGSLRLYDVDSGRERGWVAAAWVRSLAYSADGKTLAAGLRYAPGLVLWETAELVAK